MVTYSVAPYFQSKPSNAIESCTKYVVCFDEALNKVIHRGQMNIVVRFWDNDLKQVSSRYLTSVFLGHSRATDLLTFHEGLVSLPAANLLQVSLDRPTANWKFLETLKDSCHRHEQDHQLFELGSCGLHAIHGALQSGHSAAGWNVNLVLRAVYNVFKDSPARRSDYIHITGSTKFPKKFCQVRWVENTSVTQRALEVFDDVKKYVNDKSTKLPGTATCKDLKQAVFDPLTTVKMAFFSSVATELEPFLRKYQTSAPMAVFLYDDIGAMLR